MRTCVRYPRIQLDDTNQLPDGLEQAIKLMGGSYYAVVWLSPPHAGLRDTSPMDALKLGCTKAY